MKLPCLSIQQPFVEDIFNGHKPVENRGWTWMQKRDWAKEGPVRLGIHASSSHVRWNQLSDEERDECCSQSGVDEPPFGSVVGVANLIQISRPQNLPRSIRNHACVNTDPDNWCWVLDNPRRFSRPTPATGQARLFYVEVDDSLLRSLGKNLVPRELRKEEQPVGEDCWVYWEPSFADAAIERGHVFCTADLGSFSVGKEDIVWLVTYKDGAIFLTGRLKVASVLGRDQAEKQWLKLGLWDLETWPPPFPVPRRASYREYERPRVCVFASPDEIESYRWLPLQKVLSQLRFKSKTRERLTVEGGGIIPEEVVNPRRLTSESGSLLDRIWTQ
jgi:hypothetical protein